MIRCLPKHGLEHSGKILVKADSDYDSLLGTRILQHMFNCFIVFFCFSCFSLSPHFGNCRLQPQFK